MKAVLEILLVWDPRLGGGSSGAFTSLISRYVVMYCFFGDILSVLSISERASVACSYTEK